jgi:hypothetical protein
VSICVNAAHARCGAAGETAPREIRMDQATLIEMRHLDAGAAERA